MSALTWAMPPALAKRYSIWSAAGAPLCSSAAISDGVTQPCAVLVIEVATPTTVRRWFVPSL